jgi:hypothetical protein
MNDSPRWGKCNGGMTEVFPPFLVSGPGQVLRAEWGQEVVSEGAVREPMPDAGLLRVSLIAIGVLLRRVVSFACQECPVPFCGVLLFEVVPRSICSGTVAQGVSAQNRVGSGAQDD